MDFDTLLDDAINTFYAGGGKADAVITALETKLMALKEVTDVGEGEAASDASDSSGD